MVIVCAFAMCSIASAGPAKEKDAPSHTVDSGTFGVFVNGRRVATETFSIQQSSSGSVATSQFKTEAGTDQAAQSSELQLSAAGDLRKYEWKEISPGKATAIVLPNDQFLMERSTNGTQAKQDEQPFLLPASTSILDDYFFVHREILAWRYMATGCRQDKGQTQCPLNQKTQFGTLNPHARASMSITMEFTGRDKINVRGAERELNRFMLKSDAGDWALWLDDQFKLVRILIPGDNTEVVRD